jgi:hypothetical protein
MPINTETKKTTPKRPDPSRMKIANIINDTIVPPYSIA